MIFSGCLVEEYLAFEHQNRFGIRVCRDYRLSLHTCFLSFGVRIFCIWGRGAVTWVAEMFGLNGFLRGLVLCARIFCIWGWGGGDLGCGDVRFERFLEGFGSLCAHFCIWGRGVVTWVVEMFGLNGLLRGLVLCAVTRMVAGLIGCSGWTRFQGSEAAQGWPHTRFAIVIYWSIPTERVHLLSGLCHYQVHTLFGLNTAWVWRGKALLSSSLIPLCRAKMKM